MTSGGGPADLPFFAGGLLTLASQGALLWTALWFSVRMFAADRDVAKPLLALVILAVTIDVSVMILLGCFGLLSTLALAIAIGACAFALHTLAQRLPGSVVRPDPEVTASPWFVAATFGVCAGHCIFLMRNPPADLDALLYHLPMAMHWAITHALGAPLRWPPESATYYPGNLELLQSIALRVSMPLAAFAQAAWLWPLADAVRGLARRCGASRASAEGVALLTITLPVCSLVVKGLSADLAMAAMVTSAIVFLIDWRGQGRARDLAMALLALGFVAGTRFTGPAYAVVLLALAAFAPGRTRDAKVAAWWAWALALLMGGFWMVRNAIAAGNPLYPAEVPVLGHMLPGTLPYAMLRRTTQIAAWREGWAGHLAPANVLKHYSAGLAVLALAALATLWPAARARLHASALPIAFAFIAGALYLNSFYSGVNLPSYNSAPPMLATGNVRYLLPAYAAALAALAPALDALLPARFVLATLSVLCAAQMLPLGMRLGIIAALALLQFGITALIERRPALGRFSHIPFVLLIAFMPTWRAPQLAHSWQSHAAHLTLLPDALVDSLRDEAHGRTIGTVGLDGYAQVVGTRLAGRPAYIPVTRTWKQARSMWDFTPDDRARGTQARWRENLRAAEAAFVAIGWSDTSAAPPESLWCASDSAHFTLRAAYPRRLVFAVR